MGWLQGRSLKIRRASPRLAARRMRFSSTTLTRDIRRDPPHPAHHCRRPHAPPQLLFSSGKGLENSSITFAAKICQICKNGIQTAPHLEANIVQNLTKIQSGLHLKTRIQQVSKNYANMEARAASNKVFRSRGVAILHFCSILQKVRKIIQKWVPKLPQNPSKLGTESSKKRDAKNMYEIRHPINAQKNTFWSNKIPKLPPKIE